MFEETLLIIKNDYLPKRKILLIKLLGYGFQIQTNRRVLFTPELAAQFYGDNTEDGNFMLQVILMSKGPAEAFILTMDNAVEQLINSTICYFCTSMEADRHVHVSKTLKDACREIKFIFPNYICEPIAYFDKSTFCRDKNMHASMGEIYNIIKTQQDVEDWKLSLADWLQKSNKNLPIVSNACVAKPHVGYEERAAQTKTSYKQEQRIDDISAVSMKTLGSTPPGSSAQFTTSSCISCQTFASSARTEDVCKDLIAKKKAVSEVDLELRQMPNKEEQASEEHVCEGEADVEYIILQEEQAESKIEEERIALEDEQGFDDFIVEGTEVKFPETPSIASDRDLKTLSAPEIVGKQLSITVIETKSLNETKSVVDIIEEMYEEEME